MKTAVRTRKKSISLNEPIDRDYVVTLQPGERITLENGATFNKKDVAGQIFSNTGKETATFRFSEKDGEIDLIEVQKIILQAIGFDTYPPVFIPITKSNSSQTLQKNLEHEMKIPEVDFSAILPSLLEECEADDIAPSGEIIIHI